MGWRAQAHMKACSSLGDPASYKIFVDGLSTVSGATPSAALQRHLTGLREFVVNDLNNLTAGQASVRRCDGRNPTDAGDFDDLELRSLNNLRVLLEVWGVAEDGVSGGGGSLGFVLIQARTFSPLAVYTVRRDGHDFLAQAKLGTELRVFAPLALGMREFSNKHFEASIPLLCQGIHELSGLVSGPVRATEATLRADEKLLLTNLRKVVSDAIVGARIKTSSPYALLHPTTDGQFACPGS
jgi:hypothetical protein